MELLIALFVGEFYVWLPRLTQWLANRAARLLPAEDRERCLEQWLADLEALPNSLVKALFSLGLLIAVFKLRVDAAAAALQEGKDLLIAKWAVRLAGTWILFSLRFSTWAWRLLRARLEYAVGQNELTANELVERLGSALKVAARLDDIKRSSLALVVTCEARLDQLLSRDPGANYPKLRAELFEERVNVKEVRNSMERSLEGSAVRSRGLSQRLQLIVAQHAECQ